MVEIHAGLKAEIALSELEQTKPSAITKNDRQPGL
jgi:hypothetical protein